MPTKPMMYQGFRIVKTMEYVWRQDRWSGHTWHNHIPCWWVEDPETGERLAGRVHRGSNVESGHVQLARRKEAKAWIDGYVAGPGARMPNYDGKSRSSGLPLTDDDARAAFELGQDRRAIRDEHQARQQPAD